MNELRIHRETEFKLEESIDKLVVTRLQGSPGFEMGEWKSIVFALMPNAIQVQAKDPKSETPMFTAMPSLSFDGERIMEVDGSPMRLWQFSRKALEDLFFGT